MAEHLPAASNLILYRTEDGRTRIEVRLAEETVWMTQAAMAELYYGTKQNISLHLKNIFSEGELAEDRVVKEYLTTAADGKGYPQIFMRTWREKLDAFLQFNEREILWDAGKVTKAVADQLAIEQYEIFYQQRLKQDAQKEALADDAELKKYPEGEK